MFKKMILVFFFIIISTGCTAEYNLNIDNDLVIEESILIENSILDIKKQELDVDFFLDLNIDRYNSNNRYSMYMCEKEVNDDSAIVTANAIYLDFLSYKNTSPLIEEIFTNLNVVKNNNVYTLEYKAKSLDNVEMFQSSDLYSSLIDEVNVNIKLPFRVMHSNADKYNVEDGIYTWKYSKNEPTKDINIEFDVSKMRIGNTEKGLYLLLSFVIIISAIIGYAFYKYKANDKV